MPPLGPCEPCLEDGQRTQAVIRIDGAPVCKMHARGNGDAVRDMSSVTRNDEPVDVFVPTEPKPLCSRGCGKPTHRGHCTITRLAAPIAYSNEHEPKPAAITTPTTKPTQERRGHMDTLICEEVDESQLPTAAQPVEKILGRLGELWLKLIARNGGWLKVQNRDRAHATYTARKIADKAKKAGRKLETRIDDITLYCRLEAR